MTVDRYVSESLALGERSPKELIQKIKLIAPFSEPVGIAFLVTKDQSLFVLRPSSLGIAQNHDELILAVDDFAWRMSSEDIFCVDRFNEEFKVSFNCEAEGISEVYVVSKKRLRTIAFRSGNASKMAYDRALIKNVLEKELGNAPIDRKSS